MPNSTAKYAARSAGSSGISTGVGASVLIARCFGLVPAMDANPGSSGALSGVTGVGIRLGPFVTRFGAAGFHAGKREPGILAVGLPV